VLYVLDLVGVAVFSISGALAAGRKQMDLFGVIVLALVTAVGGGTLRDLILDAGPVFWVEKPIYLVVGAGAALLTVAVRRRLRRMRGVLLIADALGMSLFAVLGAVKATEIGISPVIAVVLGCMSGVAGGAVRDVLSNEIPLIFRREIYATAALASAGGFVLASGLGLGPGAAIGLGFIVGLALRLTAIRMKLELPVFVVDDD